MLIVQFDLGAITELVAPATATPDWSRDNRVNSVECGGRKNRETVTASLFLVFTELVAPATATPDWPRDNRVHQSVAEQ